jgi:hypothetical protein
MGTPYFYTLTIPANRPPTTTEAAVFLLLIALACAVAIVVIVHYRRPIAAWIMLIFYSVAAIQAFW